MLSVFSMTWPLATMIPCSVAAATSMPSIPVIGETIPRNLCAEAMIDLETAKLWPEMMTSADVSSGVDTGLAWRWSAYPSLESPAAIPSSVVDDILPTATIWDRVIFCLPS